ncbi:MAG: hypothetical protein ACE5F1_20365 [Planctomycetota bacterium]
MRVRRLPSGGQNASNAGSTMVVLIASMMPLLVITSAAVMTMSGKNQRLLDEIRHERAFLAAEAGVDEALFMARTGTLGTGSSSVRDFGNGMAFSMTPSHLQTDGIDNDRDGLTDEADEDLFHLAIIGTYRGVEKRISAYLGRTTGLPAVEGGVSLAEVPPNNSLTVRVETGSEISGWENGNPASGTGVPGLSVPAGSSANVISRFWGSSASLIVGAPPSRRRRGRGMSGTPSITEATNPLDLASIVNGVRNAADIVLTKGIDNANLGNAGTGDFHVIYGEGNIFFKKGGTGAGIMVVKGELRFERNFRFDGLVVVLGKARVWKGSVLEGAIIMGIDPDHPTESSLWVSELGRVRFSQAILDRVGIIAPPSGKYVTFNGWQQLSRYSSMGY